MKYTLFTLKKVKTVDFFNAKLMKTYGFSLVGNEFSIGNPWMLIDFLWDSGSFHWKPAGGPLAVPGGPRELSKFFI